MFRQRLSHTCLVFFLFCFLPVLSQPKESAADSLIKLFRNPPSSARPWVFWYWMHGAVSKEGIRADILAMKQAGIAGAYLMPIKDSSAAIPFQPVARQLSPAWWEMVKYAMEEARNCGLQLAMHVSDGFALAGGPWITPEISMQKLVWSREYLAGPIKSPIPLSKPEEKEGYYRDVALFAYPANLESKFSNNILIPSVTGSRGERLPFLAFEDPENKESFRCDSTCWIQFKYPGPFTVRSVRIRTGGNNYQAHRLLVQASDDGSEFRTITRLVPPRHGWQDTDEDYTHAVPATTARYFRFVYDKEGSEPGAEDLDAAKWKPSLKLTCIYLSDEPFIHQYEAKNGSVWRIAPNATKEQISLNAAIPLDKIINLSDKMDEEGNLNWDIPPGNWVIVRIGHTSTGHTNATGGAGKGLECDKFNPEAVTLQFNNWFAKAFEHTDPQLAREVLSIFHVDSWECGSQNWSRDFPNAFRQRRGYDLLPYLLTMTGVPVESVDVSERVLRDVRLTISELIHDVFYKTLAKLASEKGCRFSAESVAPTMVSDGLLHYRQVDIPMGEFWLNSPTHDKPNDMMDAISGAHIYGKPLVQAEAFTSVRMNWAEHPGNLKALGDRNFCLGINKMVLHVFTHNPWMDHKPGMTLDGVGLYYQRDQTWFEHSRAWVDYMSRCQALLQAGAPVTDIAVFTGEEIPRRSLLPDRLVNSLPGLFGKERVEQEKIRLENNGQPLRQIPDGVNHSANMADPEDWLDPLNGYAYDSFNPDALMKMEVKNGRVVLPGGASYALLVFPAWHLLQPNKGMISESVSSKILQLLRDGATIMMDTSFRSSPGLMDRESRTRENLLAIAANKYGKGRWLSVPYQPASLEPLGIPKDLEVVKGKQTVGWTHRKTKEADIYFVSNQAGQRQKLELIFRVAGKDLEILDPVTGKTRTDYIIKKKRGRTWVSLEFEASQSLFFVFSERKSSVNKAAPKPRRQEINNGFKEHWKLEFDPSYGGPANPVLADNLQSWTDYPDPAIRYYSGKVIYHNRFDMKPGTKEKRAWMVFDSIYNSARVTVNGIPCGIVWTFPYELEISQAVKPGENKVEIEVINTWHNRLIGDQLLPPEKRTTWTTAPFRLKEKPLQRSGLVGEIKLVTK